MGVSLRRVRTLLIVVAFLVSSVGLLSVRPTEVRANSISWGTNGNCNNWYPHGWSSLSWSGFDNYANGETWGYLDHWNGSLSQMMCPRSRLHPWPENLSRPSSDPGFRRLIS